MGSGLDLVAGIEETISAPSCPGRWTGREGGTVYERAGKGNSSIREKARFLLRPGRNCLWPGLLIPGTRLGGPAHLLTCGPAFVAPCCVVSLILSPGVGGAKAKLGGLVDVIQ